MKIIKLIQGALENNVFVVSSKNTDILIDPGLDTKEILTWLKDGAIEPQAILITHGHFDHMASVEKLQKEFNCDVYFGKEDQFYLDDPYGPLFIKPNSFGKIDTNFTYIPTEDKTITIGDIRIKMIKTPGHTPGSTCYFINDLNTVFTGDTLFKLNIGRTDFQKGCIKTITKSIKEKLYLLPDNVTIWPGHGECSTIKKEKNHNPYVKG